MWILNLLRESMGVDVTLAVVQIVVAVLLGCVIAIVFFTVRGLVMYVIESREKSKIRKSKS